MAQQAALKALQASLEQYDQALQAKSASLPALDAWYRTDLRKAVKARSGKSKDTTTKSKSAKPADESEGTNAGYMTRQELSKLMKWKLTRGKFRPRLEQLILSNSENDVQRITAEAFQILQKGKGKAKEQGVEGEHHEDMDWPSIDDARKALDVLNALKGVGPATSSAILALAAPHSLAFMSDEALLHAAGLRDKPKYNAAEWSWFVKEMRSRITSQDNKAKTAFTSVEDLEKAAWAHAITAKASLVSESGKRNADSVNHPKKASSASKRQRK